MSRKAKWLPIIVGLLALACHAKTVELKQCGTISRPGHYQLLNDVQTDSTCFFIAAPDVTLNLNGHSVTYGTKSAPDARPVYGIVAQACWDKGAKTGTCADRFSGLTVSNGKITQGDEAPAFSHAVRLGQGNGGKFSFADLEISIHSPASVAIDSAYTHAGMDVQRVTVHDEVKLIFNRHQVEGAALRVAQTLDDSTPNRFDRNTVLGGPQGGILDVTSGSTFTNNHLTLAGTYTNDFGIYLWGNRQQAQGNHVEGQGRGIQVYRGEGATVRENTIDVFEAAVNAEYRGCQLGGSMGIQLETRARHVRISQNDVRVTAQACDARAFRATDTEAGGDNVSAHNIYVARRSLNSSARAIAASFSNAKDVILDGDTLVADTANFEIDWDGAERIELRNVTLVKGDSPSADYATFRFWPGSNDATARLHRSQLRVIDAEFRNGASPDSFDMHPISFGEWAAGVEYSVEWSTIFRVVDPTGAPVARASIQVRGADFDTKTLVTDAHGESRAIVLPQFRRFNTLKGVETTVFTYEVVAKDRDREVTQTFRPTGKSSVEIRF